MDKTAIDIDALNKEMYNLTLHHYQTTLQQDIILPRPNNYQLNGVMKEQLLQLQVKMVRLKFGREEACSDHKL